MPSGDCRKVPAALVAAQQAHDLQSLQVLAQRGPADAQGLAQFPLGGELPTIFGRREDDASSWLSTASWESTCSSSATFGRGASQCVSVSPITLRVVRASAVRPGPAARVPLACLGKLVKTNRTLVLPMSETCC